MSISTVFWFLFGVWLAGFVVTFVGHALFLQMVTFPLALLRSVFWFLLWTGWFHGTPLRMD